MLWPVERAQAIFGRGEIDSELASQVDDRVGQEALFLCHYHNLEPKLAVAYRRVALFGTYESDLRITFDRRLQYDPQRPRPARAFSRPGSSCWTPGSS